MVQFDLLSVILTAIFLVPLTYLIAVRMVRQSIRLEYERDFHANRNLFIDESKAILGADDRQIALLKNEYLKGKIDGSVEELDKFNITYQPYTRAKEEYLGIKKTAEVGYEMQIFYSGFPIGDPTKRTTHEDVKFDQAVIDKIMNNEMFGLLNNASQLMLNKGFKSTTLPVKALTS